ncbi:amidohydrolase family protein [Sphingomonas oligoaromativorans]|uniref:amidohydrolase family protein n=1 Tax=Sphingomonas oligoaromativorans TaxID=575322 RepID=UPI00141E4646|nr:amidohydrolase family protein [Sphingomonas oligoaromativorans]NIJ35237.1 putative TIM-barrel fold metal-dependent hydrolase [Sphingomonas oligoaromativorans]
MNAIPFVDAHVHLWDLSHIRYPWLSPPFDDSGPNGSTEAIAVDYGIDEYRKDAARWNVRGVVHIDAGAEPDQALDETAWLEGLAARHGMPNGIVAFAPLQAPNVDALLEAHAAHPHVRGIRQIVNWHVNPMRTYNPTDVTLDDDWWRGFGRLGRYGLSFDLQCYAPQMAGLAPLIQRHPDVPVIINHLGMPIISEREGMTRWRYGIRALAACPNVHIKLSGLGFVDRHWTLDSIAPVLREVIDVFGPGRCLFASDSPTDKLFAPFDAYLETYHAFAADYSEAERRDMFGRNANRVYRLGLEL